MWLVVWHQRGEILQGRQDLHLCVDHDTEEQALEHAEELRMDRFNGEPMVYPVLLERIA